jgi:hypothetical protein
MVRSNNPGRIRVVSINLRPHCRVGPPFSVGEGGKAVRPVFTQSGPRLGGKLHRVRVVVSDTVVQLSHY